MIQNIFLDRDGIINEVVLRGEIIGSPRNFSEFSFRQDFLDVIPKLSEFKGNIFIVSNQPDIERGLMSLDLLNRIDREILKYFRPTEIKYCLCSDGPNCTCKKPKPGMIEDLITKYGIDQKSSIIIGDSYKDVEAGKNASIRTIFLETQYNKNTLVSKPDKIIFSLKEFFFQDFDYLCFT